MIDKELLSQHFQEFTAIRPTPGGHMAYDYGLLEHQGEDYFIKHHDPRGFSNDIKELHSRMYLHKEHETFNHLRSQGFSHIPSHNVLLDGRTLVLEGLDPNKGWHWRAPLGTNSLSSYTIDCLQALRQLESLPALPDRQTVTPSYDSFMMEGWRTLACQETAEHVQRKILSVQPDLRLENRAFAALLAHDVADLSSLTLEPPLLDTPLSHHDARQANIAWHPDHGARLVDWSWAGAGLKGADTTSFLIDLAKSGMNVKPYLSEYLNKDHAFVLIGFWLGHSIWPTRTDSETVRFHQVASAVTGYRLLLES